MGEQAWHISRKHERASSANLRCVKESARGSSLADLHEARPNRLGKLAKRKRECARSSRRDRFARSTIVRARQILESQKNVCTGDQARRICKRHERECSTNLRSVKESVRGRASLTNLQEARASRIGKLAKCKRTWARASRPGRFARITSEQARGNCERKRVCARTSRPDRFA
ncbi:hypothetical protein CRG98_013251 [Punica granatum]|uniref:Uncharacterized protein n=1 Tax=Punica granatum TaxID=22663 RepID=A0A2I0KCU7_PUNGR|nr:hypothetical protein CRG98_013251 [Punica granatum]